MKRVRFKNGFSLIEAVLAIVLLAASFVGISYVLSNTTTQNIDIDISTTAILLGRETMAITMAKDFADVLDVAQTSYGGDFSSYKYQVDVDYVDAADLDASVVGPTDYKRVVVAVTATNWGGNISLYDIKANP